MQTTQHTPRCPVYLHPAACTSPAAVDAIQRTTGLLVIITPKTLGKPTHVATLVADNSFPPFGGDAA